MDFRETPQMQAIRQEVRDVLRRALPPGWQGSGFLPMDVTPEHMEVARAVDRALAERRLLAPAWPEEYGGRGLGPYEHYALLEELGYALVPRLTTIAVDLVGPVLLLYGSEEQRLRFLPPIAREGVVWCQGFSEPEAGSDLTSLRTQAVREGDYYVVRGQKIWTSMAHCAQWVILLARTGPPGSRGLSLFAVPTDAPGLTIAPIVDATGNHMLNQLFLDGVRVPVADRIGEENEGWRYATTLLQYERGDAILVGQFRRLLDDLRALGPMARRAPLSWALAEGEIWWQIGRILNLRVVDLVAKGRLPDMEASVSKLFLSEAFQRFLAIVCGALGPYASLLGARALLAGRLSYYLVASTTATIIAGTSEIQRTIVATRGLGLPRG